VKIGHLDVCRNPSQQGSKDRPFVVVVQSDYLHVLPTRVVVPLVVEGAIKPIHRLNPQFEIEATKLYLHPVEIAALPVRALRTPVTNLEKYRYEIISALDLVFTGI
jgi:toxin CcdB